MLTYEKLEVGVFLVKSASFFSDTCNGIFIKNSDNSGNILIDCNFQKSELKELLDKLNYNIAAYFASHTHLDHVSNINFYEDHGIEIYCPIPEDRYLKDMDVFIRENGMTDFGVDEIFRKIIYEELNFKNLTDVTPIEPNSKFLHGNVTLKTLPIPGHSPGQIAFMVSMKNGERKKILFVSDIGIEKTGPWYGLNHCSLNEYRNSLNKIEALYLKNHADNIILVSSHGDPYIGKQPEIFKKTLRKIESNETKVLNLFKSGEPKSLNDITLKGTFYPIKFVANLHPNMKRIHDCWEGYIMLHHINELIEKDILKVADPVQKTFILK
ncbi:MAG: MBL fold metallo-hydrolase [Promethearchaeota archaeon]|jgi:glyoxylase-like metal-dependent hydrolase (beta-lactamase superfamily II)